MSLSKTGTVPHQEPWYLSKNQTDFQSGSVTLVRGVVTWVIWLDWGRKNVSLGPKLTFMQSQVEGGTHMLRHTGMCRPNGPHFHQKSLDMGPMLVIKILREGSHFTKIAKKMVKSAVLKAEKLLEMGLDLQKVRKKLSNQPFFECQNSLDMGRGFGPRAAHFVKK